MNKITKLLFSLGGAFTLFALDNCIKEKIEDGSIANGDIPKTEGLLEIEKHHNMGLPLNKLSDHTKEISVLSTAITGAQIYRTVQGIMEDDDSVMDFSNTLILAGALSNTYDRVKRGYVVDYLKVGKKKKTIYNISDFFIIFGVIVTFLKSLKK